MNKIGLVLAYRGVNYGMLLQAFALQKFIDSLGYQNEILEYSRTSLKHIRFTPWLCVYGFVELEKRIRKKFKKLEKLDLIHEKNINDRKLVSNSFIELNLHDRVVIKGILELEKEGAALGGAVVGSDQIWPPDAAFGNFTTLRFVPDNINKVSYATSLGVSSYPIYTRSSARQFWQRFDHLSVREGQGKKIIQDICNVPVEVVLDPTYLFTAEQWKELIPEETLLQEEYILCYFLGDAKEHKLLSRAFANKVGLKLVSILSTESVSEIDISYADKVITGKGPEYFVNLVRNAKYVLTDSFHGVAFSIINNKQFYVFYRTKKGSKNSRNSRIDNILHLWGLEDRLIQNDASLSDFSENPIDYEMVNSIIESERKKSISYLVDSLGDCK